MIALACPSFGGSHLIPGGFRKIVVADGLPSSEVYEAYQDRMGYLWLATDAGVCRYNGLSFTTFTTLNGLTDNTAFHITEDSKGRIWVQTFNGAICYFENNRFWPIAANDSLIKVFSSGQKTQYTFFVDKNDCIVVGGLYVGGCYRISPSENYSTLHPIGSPIHQICARQLWTDSLHQLYASGESMYNDHSIAMINHNGHEVSVRSDYSVAFGVNMRTLLTTTNRVMFSHKEVLYVVEPDGNVSEHKFKETIIGLDEDPSGDIWVNLLMGGTFRFPAGNLNATGICYLPGYSISSVCQDSEKGYWISNVGSGLFYLAGLEFGYLTQNEGLPLFTIASLCPLGNGKVFLGQAFSTISMVRTQPSFNSQLISGSIGLVREISTEVATMFQGKLFCNTDKSYLVDTTMRTLSSPEPARHLKGYTIHPGGDTLFGYSHSAFVWIDKDFKQVKTSLAPVRITAACYIENVLWLGGLNGLWKMNDTTPEYKGTMAKGLDTRIDDMVGDVQGRLWIATRGNGVFVVDHDTVHHFDRNAGLSSNTCRGISLDEKGNIWVATNKGISVISDYNRFKGTASIEKYNTTDGLLSDEVNFVEIKDGIVWLAGPDGLCWVPTNKLLVNMTPPPVYIISVICGSDTFSAIDSVVVNHNDNRVRILCEGISLRNSSKISYKYKLSESNEDWMNTQSREITFNNLEPGDYTLVIYALNANGIASREPAMLQMHVTRPFTKTFWFYALIVAAFFLLVVLSVRMRLNVVKQKAARRSSEERRMAELRLSALRAQMNPHFIFNAINSIQHYVLNNDSEKAYSYLAKFSKLIRLVLDQSQSNTITLKQELELLGLYVELEQLRFEHPISIEWFVAPEIDQSGVRLPGMLIQPYIENSIWHGLLPLKEREGVLKIHITESVDNLIVVVEDNGIGRAAAQKVQSESSRRSYGMLITNERLKLLDKSEFNSHRITVIDLHDVNGNPIGTRVEILLSLSNLHD